MAEFGEAAIEAAEAASEIGEIIGKGEVEINPVEIERFNESFAEMNKIDESIKVNFSVDQGTGQLEVSGQLFGENINVKAADAAKAFEEFGPNAKDNPVRGNVGELLERTTGVKTSSLPEASRNVINNLTDQVQNSEVYQTMDALNEAESLGSKAGEGLKPEVKSELENQNINDPTAENNINKLLEENKELRDKFDAVEKKLNELEEDAKSKGKSGVEVGKWVKYLIPFGLLGVGGFFIYKLVKEHQNKMNGCWLVKANGSKCKLQFLTCDNGAKNEGGICEGSVQDNVIKSCKDPCPVDKNNPANFCANQNDICSSFCDTSKFNLNKGEFIRCVNVDWFGAASDLVGDWLGDIFNPIFTILKYFLIGVACLIGVFVLYKIFSWLFSKKEDKETTTEPKNEPVKVQDEPKNSGLLKPNVQDKVQDKVETVNKPKVQNGVQNGVQTVNKDKIQTKIQTKVQDKVEAVQSKPQTTSADTFYTPNTSFSFGKKKGYSRDRCNALLRKKISINMGEMKSGRYVSPSQALAVSYSQIKTKYPSCKRFFRKN